MSAIDFKPESWTTSSTQALKISLVGENAIQFPPVLTHPIFGQSEQIFGYKDLVIHLVFDSITMKPFFNFKFSEKLENTEVDDIKKNLLKFLPEGDTIFKDENKWIDCFEQERLSYNLPDPTKKIFEYSIGDETFEIYRLNISDPFCRKLHDRIQVLSLLFIDGASYIDPTDSNWDIFWTFNQSTKQCIGYSTTYKYWTYINGKEFDKEDNNKFRAKISQFLILPPYQNKGHGSNLYNSITSQWVNDPSIIEITIEDPNEGFDDMRDRCDLLKLKDAGVFESVNNELSNNKENMKKNNKCKIESRQFSRLVEMICLYENLAIFEDLVKSRLYKKNYDALVTMDKDDQKEALEKAFLLNKDNYYTILSSCKFLKRKQHLTEESETNSNKKMK